MGCPYPPAFPARPRAREKSACDRTATDPERGRELLYGVTLRPMGAHSLRSLDGSTKFPTEPRLRPTGPQPRGRCRRGERPRIAPARFALLLRQLVREIHAQTRLSSSLQVVPLLRARCFHRPFALL